MREPISNPVEKSVTVVQLKQLTWPFPTAVNEKQNLSHQNLKANFIENYTDTHSHAFKMYRNHFNN